MSFFGDFDNGFSAGMRYVDRKKKSDSISDATATKIWADYAKDLEKQISQLKDELATKDAQLKSARLHATVYKATMDAKIAVLNESVAEADKCPQQTAHTLNKPAVDASGRPVVSIESPVGHQLKNHNVAFAHEFDRKLRMVGMKNPEDYRIKNSLDLSTGSTEDPVSTKSSPCAP